MVLEAGGLMHRWGQILIERRWHPARQHRIHADPVWPSLCGEGLSEGKERGLGRPVGRLA
jgi:hypothetical protein